MYETKNLILQTATIEDAPFYFKLMNTPKWYKYIGDRNVHTVEETAVYMSKNMLSQIERLGYGNFTLIRKEDGVKIGTCGIFDREGLEGVDLGFGFLPEYEGQGYGYESSVKVIELAFHKFNIKALKAITLPDNIPSQKLLEKLGFTKTGLQQIGNKELWVYRLER